MTPSEVFPDEPFDIPEAAKAMYAPLGATSPLWFLFAGAASAGLAYWWATRWTQFTNLEAMFAPAVEAAEAVVEVAPLELVSTPEPEPDLETELVEAASPPAVATKLAEPEPLPEPVVEAALEPVLEVATEPMIEAAPEPRPMAKAKAPKAAPGPEA
jgi:hypothetical protein